MFSLKAASPQFDKGNKKSGVIRSGMNNVNLVTELLVENRYLAALLFSKMISKEPIHVEMKYKAVVSLQPIFIIPIELPIDGESLLYPNQPGTSSMNTMSTDSVSLNFSEDNRGVMLNLKWNIVHSPSSANISFPIPELELAILSRGHTIALVHNDPGQYSLTSIQSTTVMIPSIQNSLQAKEIRAVTQNVLQQNVDGLALQIAGLSDNSAPMCMLQSVLNMMPPTSIDVAGVVTQALRRQEQAIAVKKSGEDSKPAVILASAGVKLLSFQRHASHPFSFVLSLSAIYSSKIESNISMAPFKLDIGANDAAFGQVTVTPLPISTLDDGFREASLEVLFDCLDEDQLVSLIRDFVLSKGNVTPSLRVLRHHNTGSLADILSGMEFGLPGKTGRSGLFGLQPHIHFDGGRTGDAMMFVLTLTNPAKNLAFFNVMPIILEIPSGTAHVFISESKPLVVLDWNRTEVGFLDHSATLSFRAQVKREHAQNAGKLVNMLVNDDVVRGLKISLSLNDERTSNFELAFSEFKLSDLKRVYMSSQIDSPNIFLKYPTSMLEMIDFLSADYSDRLKISLLSRFRYPKLNLTLKSFPRLKMFLKTTEGETTLAELQITERVQQAHDAPLIFISSSVSLHPNLAQYRQFLVTGPSRLETIADVILSQLQCVVAFPYSAPKSPPVHLNITSNSDTLYLMVSTTVPALSINPAIRLSLQPMLIVITDSVHGESLDIGSVVVKPVVLSNKGDSDVSIEFKVFASSRQEEFELARLIKRIFTDKDHHFVMQLVPDPMRHIEGLIPFHSWINSSVRTSVTPSSQSLFKLNSIRVIPIGYVDQHGNFTTKLSIPCFTRFPLCQFDRTSLQKQMGITFEISIQAISGLVSPFSLIFPALHLSVDYENQPMMRISTTEFRIATFSKDAITTEIADLRFNTTLLILDTETLGAAYDSIVHPISRRQPRFSFHTSGRGGNLISRILSQCGVSKVIGSSPNSSSLKNLFKYTLVQTNSSIAVLDIDANLPIKLPVQANLGDVRATFSWNGVPFADLTTRLDIPQNSTLDLKLTLRLLGDPHAGPEVCQGSQCINPKMYTVNKVFEAALMAIQTDSTLPVLLELTFNNSYNIEQKWSVNFTVFDEDPPLERSAKPRSKFGILQSMTIDFQGVIKQVFHLVRFNKVTLPLRFKVKNPLAFQFSINHMESESYFTDSDGVSGPFIIPFKPQAPDPKVHIASISDSNRWVLPANESIFVDVNFLANKTGFLNLSARFVDEQVLHQRLCLHLENTQVDLELKAENHEPLLYTQQFALKNYPAISSQDCLTEKRCYPKLETIRQFSIRNFIPGKERIPFVVNGDATISSNGSILELTSGRNQHSSVFWNDPIQVLSSWAFETVFRMERLSITKGHGIAIVIQGEGALAKSRSKFGIKIAKDVPELSFVLNNGLHDSVRVFVNGTLYTQTFRIPVTFDDGKYHVARLIYSHLEQRFDLFIDRFHTLVILYDLQKLSMPDQRAWIGITGSSGLIKFSRQLIKEMKILQPRSDLLKMKLVETGKIISSVGERGHFTLDSRDTCGMPLFCRKSAQFSLALSHGNKLYDVTDAIEDDESGLYRVPVLLPTQGTYHVLMKIHKQGNSSNPWIRIGDVMVGPEFG